eukprot:COSAG06_NODE_1689_length_8706_cov_7.834669_1_plen_95_part_00
MAKFMKEHGISADDYPGLQARTHTHPPLFIFLLIRIFNPHHCDISCSSVNSEPNTGVTSNADNARCVVAVAVTAAMWLWQYYGMVLYYAAAGVL